ncbi:hypothetical protein L1987_64979 [Smallanthus sonchifolius]|uniref:Uncharacterized protein n=1 Tax=Smallanthus sonchifolius TaxID=185202 RepID=A0ACB9BT59_9ASTR|nr:hypothetical protein L1987_64979 [Smallanthus sonchifolius]
MSFIKDDLECFHPDDLEEMDIQHSHAMLSLRAKQFYTRTGRPIPSNNSNTIVGQAYQGQASQGNTRPTQTATCAAVGITEFDWRFQYEDLPANNQALMADTTEIPPQVYEHLCSQACIDKVLGYRKHNQNLIDQNEEFHQMKFEFKKIDDLLVKLKATRAKLVEQKVHVDNLGFQAEKPYNAVPPHADYVAIHEPNFILSNLEHANRNLDPSKEEPFIFQPASTAVQATPKHKPIYRRTPTEKPTFNRKVKKEKHVSVEPSAASKYVANHVKLKKPRTKPSTATKFASDHVKPSAATKFAVDQPKSSAAKFATAQAKPLTTKATFAADRIKSSGKPPQQWKAKSTVPQSIIIGSDSKGGSVTGQGTMSNERMSIKRVNFVKELDFNLMSVSQICNQKHWMRFTDKECFVLSLGLSKPHPEKILLIAQRKDNLYELDVNEVTSSGSVSWFCPWHQLMNQLSGTED